MIIHINKEEELDELIAKGDVLLDLFATWCGPCRMLSPILEELDEEGFPIQIAKVDVDLVSSIAIKNGVQAIPTLILYKNGQVAKKFTGFMRKDQIKDFCNL